MTTDGSDLSRQYLAEPRFEVLPLRGALDAASQLPHGSTVTVTSSPAKGIGATVELATRLTKVGYHAVPHLAARLVTDRTHLREILGSLAESGVTEVFVVGGDSPKAAGEFEDALSLLQALEDLDARPSRVGIAGYPESHATIPDAATTAALESKSAHADYIVSQICYDAQTIAAWVKSLRARDITLPVYIGAPGAVDTTKLLRISMKIGLGDSMRYLRKQHGVVGRLVSGYNPENLFNELEPYLSDPEYGIAGWHLFTFNEVAKTQRWLANISTLEAGTA